MTRRSSPSSTAKVSDEGTAVIRHAKTELAKHEAQVEAEKENQDDTTSIVAMVVEQLARMYGYALIGCAYNVMYALGVSALPLTNWQGDGATAASASGAVPVVDRWAWGGLFIGGLFGAVVFPLRCTFAIATGSPHTLPGSEIESWDCALVCLVSMVLSTSANVGLTAFLPLAYGACPQYYFLDLVPIILCFTLCIIFTRRVMRAYLDSVQGGKQDPRATGLRNNGQTTSTTQRKPNKQQHGSLAKKKIAAPGQQPRKEKIGIWAEISRLANMILLTAIVFGCESMS